MLTLHPSRGDGAGRKASAADGASQQGKITGVLCETSCVYLAVNPARQAGSCPTAFPEVTPGLSPWECPFSGFDSTPQDR